MHHAFFRFNTITPFFLSMVLSCMLHGTNETKMNKSMLEFKFVNEVFSSFRAVLPLLQLLHQKWDTPGATQLLTHHHDLSADLFFALLMFYLIFLYWSVIITETKIHFSFSRNNLLFCNIIIRQTLCTNIQQQIDQSQNKIDNILFKYNNINVLEHLQSQYKTSKDRKDVNNDCKQYCYYKENQRFSKKKTRTVY